MTPDSFSLRDFIEIGTLIILVLAYLLDRRKDRQNARQISDQSLSEGSAKHEQNSSKLRNLEEFNQRQADINKKRDRQIEELMAQTTTLTAIATGMDRRLEMLEDGRH